VHTGNWINKFSMLSRTDNARNKFYINLSAQVGIYDKYLEYVYVTMVFSM
jgi:hypothetical protein